MVPDYSQVKKTANADPTPPTGKKMNFHSWTGCLSCRCHLLISSSVFLICLLWFIYYLHVSFFPVSVFSPSVTPLVLTLTFFFHVVLCLCLLPVGLRSALSLMYLRPPQAAVFTRPLQGGNRRRMTWSMFPAAESTAISSPQLSAPFFIMSCLCGSRYR